MCWWDGLRVTRRKGGGGDRVSGTGFLHDNEVESFLSRYIGKICREIYPIRVH